MKIIKKPLHREMKQSNQESLPLSFQGLKEKDINALYKLAPMKKLRSGDVLIKEKDTDQTGYIILKGKVKIIKSVGENTIELGILEKGDWVGEITLIRQIPRTATVIAVEPSTVMAIDQHLLETLGIDAQLHFLKYLNQLSAERISRLEEREKELSQKNRRLMTDIFHQCTQRSTGLQDSELIQDILKKIPKLPAFANTIMSSMMDEKISAAQITREAEKDPALVGVILKTINSCYYGFQKKIADIQHAITLLGFNQLYHLISSEGLRRTMPDLPEFHDLHFHCVVISQIAFNISQAKHISKPTQMATIGLLHDLGDVVVLFLKRQNPKLASIIEVLDRSQLGGCLLDTWNLPNHICKTIEFQHYPEFSPPENIPVEIRENVALIYLSHLCYGHLEGKTEDALPTTFLRDYTSLLNMGNMSLAEISNRIVLPGFRKKINFLPIRVKELIEDASQNDALLERRSA